MPRTITHELKLRDAREPFVAFLAQTNGLAEKRGPLLVQLPPSLSFDAASVTAFLDLVRDVYDGPVVCEPRHATWFSPQVSSILDQYRISRVAADPPPVPAAGVPAGWPGVAYFRLHGSPRKYWSRYDENYIDDACGDRPQHSDGRGGVVCVRQHRKRRRDRECLGAARTCNRRTAWLRDLHYRLTHLTGTPCDSGSCDTRGSPWGTTEYRRTA